MPAAATLGAGGANRRRAARFSGTWRRVSDAPERPKLPEEFAPTGKKLSRFAIQAAPPIRPRLFPDEKAFALRLALLAGAGELAAWAAIGRALVERRDSVRSALLLAAAAGAALRALRPLWSWLGTKIPRPLVAALLLLGPLLIDGLWLGLPERTSGLPLSLVLLALSLPALGDLAASTIADAVTIDRRAAALSALEMGQGLGLALGLAVGASSPRALFNLLPPLALVIAAASLTDLRDRGTPRSTWPISSRLEAARASWVPLLLVLATGAFSAAALAISPGVTLAGKALPLYGATVWLILPLAGMAVFAQLEARINRLALPLWICAALSLAAALLSWLGLAREGLEGVGGSVALFALGGTAASLPATILRGAAEMDRAPASSLAWTALAVGAGVGALAGWS